MPETLTVAEYVGGYDLGEDVVEREAALLEAEHDDYLRYEDAMQQAASEDALVSRLADEIAHHHCGMPNEPQVFLAARNAAEDVLVSCRIRFGEDRTPFVSEEDDERASEAAKAAGRAAVYRFLRVLAARRGRPPGFWPTATAFRAPRPGRPRAARTRRIARSASRGDPSEPPDLAKRATG